MRRAEGVEPDVPGQFIVESVKVAEAALHHAGRPAGPEAHDQRVLDLVGVRVRVRVRVGVRVGVRVSGQGQG